MYFFHIYASPDLTIRHSHLDYARDGREYPIRKKFFLSTISGYGMHFEFTRRKSVEADEFGTFKPKHRISFDFDLKPGAPKLYDLVDITDDSNPLNIYLGNPDLKVEYNLNPMVEYYFSGSDRHPLSNVLTLEAGVAKNALTQGYTYNTTTGVRVNRMYNVDGNRNFSARNNFNIQFGSINQFHLTSTTGFNMARVADMVGENATEPTLSKVDNLNVNQYLRMVWQIGKQSITLSGEYTNRHSTSSRPGFRPYTAHLFSYGVIANFKLPYNIGINTDFNLYGRRGYGVKELDTDDAIWNLRLTWTPAKAKQWTFMLDGFDLLHQLSNVNYAVTATGRTVSYSNALPRYVLFSVQYRFQRQPKKKR